MSFRFTLDEIQLNETNIGTNDTELANLMKTGTGDVSTAGTLANLIQNMDETVFPSAVQNTNTDVSFSGDHKKYADSTAFNSDTATAWHTGDTATIGTSIYFFVGTDGSTNSGGSFLADNFIILNGVTTVALNDVTDVNVLGATTGQILQFSGSGWTAETAFGVGNITLSNATYMTAVSSGGTAAAATYNASSFAPISGAGATAAPSAIPEAHTLYYRGFALIRGVDYTLGSDGESIEVLSSAQGEFASDGILHLVTTSLS